ncbi:recombinase RecT [Streptomyces sp. NPDC018019]|uniref:recombinase RecT n=1 Tax=Streptomyces sp. NPDC018019 TaxID=3365030 RepID=UPI0037BDDF13
MTVATLPTRAPQQQAALAHPAPGGALSLGHMSPHEAWQFSEALAGANLLPAEYRNNPASVLWAMEYGRALGLDVVTTITTIHVIKGKPTQSADLMLSRAREAGHKVRIRPGNESCVVSIWRHDDPEFENRVEWTLDDARRAQLYPGKSDSNWAKYPRAMLRARAIAECVRSACPEVLHGAIYTPEELGEVVDQEGNPVIVERADAPVQQQATVVQQAPADGPPRDFLAEATAAETADAVRALYKEAAQSGAPREYLADLAAIGADKPGARTDDEHQDDEQHRDDQEETPEQAPAAESGDQHAAALAELLAVGTALSLTAEHLDDIARAEHGRPAAECTAEQLATLTADLRAAVEGAAA